MDYSMTTRSAEFAEQAALAESSGATAVSAVLAEQAGAYSKLELARVAEH